MRLKIDRHTISIIPESVQDIAYIEDTLCLTEDGKMIRLERIDCEDGRVRLETDITPIEAEVTKPIPRVDPSQFKDIVGSWDDPPRAPITLVDVEKVQS